MPKAKSRIPVNKLVDTLPTLIEITVVFVPDPPVALLVVASNPRVV